MTAIDTHADHSGHDHDHPPFLAHHWDNPEQQFEAGKLGMWLFLATEVLLFSGLFCAYAVIRHNHPEIFAYGSQFLDTRWGAINTVVLILSSVTMASAVWAAQTNRQGWLKTCLVLTFLGAVTFMGIKYIEYSHKFHDNLVWGTTFYEPPVHGDEHGAAGAHAEDAHAADDHAAAADEALLVAPPVVEEITVTDEGVLVPRTAVADVGHAPAGLVSPEVATGAEEHAEKHSHLHTGEVDHGGGLRATDPNRPANAHLFFGVYFCMTGLHGIHVVLGMIVIGWLFVRSCKGHFNHEYFTPVDLGGLYWHVVDLIWIFLFPLLYLI